MTDSLPTSRRPLPVHRDHARDFAGNHYVYAVVSRRSRGVSIGINLNPDKVCNFDCVYCQVDRTTPGPTAVVDLPRLSAELEDMLDRIASAELFRHPRFIDTPPELRVLKDIAFSGDGEPTTARELLPAALAVADLKRRRGLAEVKLVLITNATQLHRPLVQQALQVLGENQGEIWAKLEAGTEDYYRQIERTTIPLQRILDNITLAARRWPVIIQALFLRLHGQPPSLAEREAFCDRLNEIQQAGGTIQRVQVYTVARRPAEPFVTALGDDEVDALVRLVQERTGLPAEPFYGV